MNAPESGSPAEPDWVLCGSCRGILYGKRLARNLGVCPQCGHCGPLTATSASTCSPTRAPCELFDAEVPAHDPLTFIDSRPYPDRLAEAREATGLAEAVVCARLRIGGTPVVAAVDGLPVHGRQPRRGGGRADHPGRRGAPWPTAFRWCW